jgi:universal stress protein A
MIALKQVLVATDFSDAADAALRYGRALAHAFGATLHVIHVVPDPLSLPWNGVPEGTALGALQQEWEGHARDRIAMGISDRDQAVLRVQIAVRTGEPVRQIVDYAIGHGIDLIVLGTRGRGPVAHLLLGSVAERTVRYAPCPVLTIRPNQHEFVRETPAIPARAERPAPRVPELVGA